MRSIGRVRRSTPARCIVRRPGYGRLRDQTQRRVIPAMALAPTSHTRPFSRARTAARAVVSFTVHRRSVLRDRAAARNEPLHTPLCRFGRSRNGGMPVRVRTVVRLVPAGPAGRRRPAAAMVAQRVGLLRAVPVTRTNTPACGIGRMTRAPAACVTAIIAGPSPEVRGVAAGDAMRVTIGNVGLRRPAKDPAACPPSRPNTVSGAGMTAVTAGSRPVRRRTVRRNQKTTANVATGTGWTGPSGAAAGAPRSGGLCGPGPGRSVCTCGVGCGRRPPLPVRSQVQVAPARRLARTPARSPVRPAVRASRQVRGRVHGPGGRGHAVRRPAR